MQCVAGDSYVPISQDDTAQEGWLCMSFTKGSLKESLYSLNEGLIYGVFFIFLSQG